MLDSTTVLCSLASEPSGYCSLVKRDDLYVVNYCPGLVNGLGSAGDARAFGNFAPSRSRLAYLSVGHVERATSVRAALSNSSMLTIVDDVDDGIELSNDCRWTMIHGSRLPIFVVPCARSRRRVQSYCSCCLCKALRISVFPMHPKPKAGKIRKHRTIVVESKPVRICENLCVQGTWCCRVVRSKPSR
jgi:hypothetical protein